MADKPQPVDTYGQQTAPRLTILPAWKDPQTGALYVHESLLRHQEPYAEEAHIAPMKVTERFGDVESFVVYVRRYGAPDTTLATWNSHGLKAILDYADEAAEPGRCQWLALHPFTFSVQWYAWMKLAGGQPMGQKAAVEALEDLGADIVEPVPADLMNLLRSLRASVNAKADAELRPDGSTSIAFTRDTNVKAGTVGSATVLPASFGIAIPVLKGHVDDNGRPVLYRLDVRLRVSVDDAAHLALRFSIPSADRVLENVYADRVQLATKLLGDEFALLRAAD